MSAGDPSASANSEARSSLREPITSTNVLDQCGQLMHLAQPLLATAGTPALTALLCQAEALVVEIKAVLLEADSSAGTLLWLPTDALQHVLKQLDARDLSTLECCSTKFRGPVELCVESRAAEAHGVHGPLMANVQPPIKVSSTYRLHWLEAAKTIGKGKFAESTCSASRSRFRQQQSLEACVDRAKWHLHPPSVTSDDPVSFALAVFAHTHQHLLEDVSMVRRSDSSKRRSHTLSMLSVCAFIREASKVSHVPTVALEWMTTLLSEATGPSFVDAGHLCREVWATADAIMGRMRLEESHETFTDEPVGQSEPQSLRRLRAIYALLWALLDQQTIQHSPLQRRQFMERIAGVAHQMIHLHHVTEAGLQVYAALTHRAREASATNPNLLDSSCLPAWLGAMAKTLETLGRHEEAEAAWREEHQLYMAHSDPVHVASAIGVSGAPLDSIADMFHNLGLYKKAASARRELIVAIEALAVRFPSDPWIAEIVPRYLWHALYDLLQSLDDVSPVDWLEVETVARRLLVAPTPWRGSSIFSFFYLSCNVHSHLAESLEEQSKYAEAEDVRRSQLSLIQELRAKAAHEDEEASEELLQKLDERYQDITLYLAEDLMKQGKFGAAEPFAREAACAFEKSGHDEDMRAESVACMVSVLRGLERWAEADEWAATHELIQQGTAERDEDAGGEEGPPRKRQREEAKG
jgi:hypothetical protein